MKQLLEHVEAVLFFREITKYLFVNEVYILTISSQLKTVVTQM